MPPVQQEPTVLPARVPHLLVNGAAGIAVGIATNIPPHNLREIVDGLCALIHNPDITVKQLMQHIPAPDFPTGALVVVICITANGPLYPPCSGCSPTPGGLIMETETIGLAYHDGRGSISVRGRAHVEEDDASGSRGSKTTRKSGSSGKPQIVITELPYQSNKVCSPTFYGRISMWQHMSVGAIAAA